MTSEKDASDKEQVSPLVSPESVIQEEDSN